MSWCRLDLTVNSRVISRLRRSRLLITIRLLSDVSIVVFESQFLMFFCLTSWFLESWLKKRYPSLGSTRAQVLSRLHHHLDFETYWFWIDSFWNRLLEGRTVLTRLWKLIGSQLQHQNDRYQKLQPGGRRHHLPSPLIQRSFFILHYFLFLSDLFLIFVRCFENMFGVWSWVDICVESVS